MTATVLMTRLHHKAKPPRPRGCACAYPGCSRYGGPRTWIDGKAYCSQHAALYRNTLTPDELHEERLAENARMKHRHGGSAVTRTACKAMREMRRREPPVPWQEVAERMCVCVDTAQAHVAGRCSHG